MGGFSPEEWQARQEYWARELGRLRLGVEPLEEQLARYRRATWVLTTVSGGIAAIILALFTAFGAAQIGAGLAGLVWLPIVALAWLEYRRMKKNAARYESERRQFEQRARF
jgi:hypothetical protein